MSLKKYKPTSPGRRNMSVIVYKDYLTTDKPYKPLLEAQIQNSGRNNLGRITVRHRGGGVKHMYRKIDFKRHTKLNIPAIVQSIEYDPNRTAFIALVMYADGERRYILAPDGLKKGDSVICSPKAKVKTGNCMQLQHIPAGFAIHNVEIQPGRGGQIARSAGSSARVVSIDGNMAQVMFSSGSIRVIPKECYATIGMSSNLDHNNEIIGKAGRVRLKGRRPEVLGKSMNPVDHPHGGGEGHSPIGLKYPKTPWGLPALGVKTRKPKKYSNRLILKGRNK
jgi:large subunit ribosomal protein L2